MIARSGNGVGTELLTDVDAVVVPVTTRHVLVDVGIDSRHGCDLGAVVRAACWGRVEVEADDAGWWCRG